MGRHLLRHVTVMAAAVGILVLVGVPWATASPLAWLPAAC